MLFRATGISTADCPMPDAVLHRVGRRGLRSILRATNIQGSLQIPPISSQGIVLNRTSPSLTPRLPVIAYVCRISPCTQRLSARRHGDGIHFIGLVTSLAWLQPWIGEGQPHLIILAPEPAEIKDLWRPRRGRIRFAQSNWTRRQRAMEPQYIPTYRLTPEVLGEYFHKLFPNDRVEIKVRFGSLAWKHCPAA